MSKKVVLKAVGLCRDFHGFTAVNNVSLDIYDGDIHAVIGPNGAGKTTFFNLLTGFLPPTSGSIYFKDQNVTGKKPEDIANIGIVRSFQISSVFTDLTVLENVKISLQRKEKNPLSFIKSNKVLDKYNDEAMEIIQSVRLENETYKLASSLAYGQKRALELATSIALNPSLILLDEPTQGMGHEDVDHVMELVKNISKNRTIVMVEHNMKVVSGVCNRVTVLNRGKEIITDSYEVVSKNDDVLEAYIGKKKNN